MEFFVARQAILDRRQSVYAYELLFRSSHVNVFDGKAGAVAASRVIINSFFSSIGIEKLLHGKLGFINLDRDLLVDESATILPPDRVVIEVLESVEPDPQVVAACRRLKEKGFTLALDDFVYSPKLDPLIALADILKVDFLTTEKAEQQSLMRRFGKQGVTMLAEKIETPEDFDSAREMGYSYFQGYFFAHPVVMSGRHAPILKMNYLHILQEIQALEPDLDKIERLVSQDDSLSSQLLRYGKAASNRQEKIKKWVPLAIFCSMADDKPRELVVNAVIRAFFCESLGIRAGLEGRSDLFLMGLFSRLDALLDRPLGDVLAELNLAKDVQETLLGSAPESNPLRGVYLLACAYEAAHWQDLTAQAERMNLPEEEITGLYIEAVSSCEEVFRTD